MTFSIRSICLSFPTRSFHMPRHRFISVSNHLFPIFSKVPFVAVSYRFTKTIIGHFMATSPIKYSRFKIYHLYIYQSCIYPLCVYTHMYVCKPGYLCWSRGQKRISGVLFYHSLVPLKQHLFLNLGFLFPWLVGSQSAPESLLSLLLLELGLQLCPR